MLIRRFELPVLATGFCFFAKPARLKASAVNAAVGARALPFAQDSSRQIFVFIHEQYQYYWQCQ